MRSVTNPDSWFRSLALAAAWGLAASTAAVERSSAEPPPIHLQSRVVDREARMPEAVGDAGADRVHLIASFSRPITRRQIDRLRSAHDVIVLDRCPVNAYVLSVPLSLARNGRLQSVLPEDSQVAPLLATDKLSPALQPRESHGGTKVPPYTARHKDLVEVLVLFFGDVEVAKQARAFARHRAVPLQRLSAVNGWRIALPEGNIAALAQRDPVKWVEEGPPPPQDDNDQVRGPKGVNADAVQAPVASSGHDLSGQGVVIAQWETSNASATHPDLAPRVTIGDLEVENRTRMHRYADGNGNGFYDAGDPLYLDVDDTLSVTAGDKRPPAYEVVQPGDADASPPKKLRELRHGTPPYESYFNPPAEQRIERVDFDPGEAAYMEQDNTGRGTVTAGAVCTIDQMEKAPDPDAAIPTCGDIRRTDVPRNDATLPPYAEGSTVQTGDEDVGRILRTRSYPPHWHATHVAGTMIGSGAKISLYKGVAPGAGLLTYSVKRLDLDPDDVSIPDYDRLDATAARDEHKAAIEAGATIANNSWSVRDYYCEMKVGDYGQRAQSTLNDALASGYNSDGVASSMRRMLLVYSAGNKGEHTCWPWRTVPVANSAKNVLTVANVAPGSSPGVAVLSDDSSRGPTGSPTAPDGRLKPDLGAPGRELARYHGVKSSIPPEALVPQGSYSELGGTSMAAPAVSGSAALLSEWYKRSCDLEGPTPDLLRAALVHTANDVRRFLVVNGESEQSVEARDFTGPDYGSGYGAIDVAAAVEVLMHHRMGALLDPDAPIEYSLSVGDVPRLRVTLAWDDPPYSCLCASDPDHGVLQNDLDILLIDPDGKKHAPWQLQFNPADPSAHAERSGPISGDVSSFRDHRNTIEQIDIESPMPGAWKIRVSASKLNPVFEAQPFAIVSEFLPPATDDPALCPGGDGE